MIAGDLILFLSLSLSVLLFFCDLSFILPAAVVAVFCFAPFNCLFLLLVSNIFFESVLRSRTVMMQTFFFLNILFKTGRKSSTKHTKTYQYTES